MSTQLTLVQNEIFQCEQRFNAVNAFKLNFKREASFALQLLGNNSFLLSVASENPSSLENAISNLAAIGISLNPATKEAYLVPRNRSVCLDISAIGLIKLATDSGSIEWAQAKLFHKNDKFTDNGVGKEPTHIFEAFGDRGPVLGVYAVAKTKSGDFLTETMSIKECHDIRDRSEAWKSFKAGKAKSCPWATDEGEMMKKTVIKKASKYWPKSERLDTAVQVLNEHEGIDFSNSKAPSVDPESFLAPNPEQNDLHQIEEKMMLAKRTHVELLKYLNGRFPHDDLQSLDELKGHHVAEANKALDSIIAKTGAK